QLAPPASTGIANAAPASPAPTPTAPESPPPAAGTVVAGLAPPPLPRPDFRAAAAAVMATPCSLITPTVADDTITLTGFVRGGEEGSLRRTLAEFNVPGEAVRFRLRTFEGPYCRALDIVRPYLARGERASVRGAVLGTQPLAKGELLRLNVGMPDYPSRLNVSYLMSSGDAVQLVGEQAEAPGAQVRLGDPRQGFPGWEVDEPYGTDMLLMVASERPLFPQRRPAVEKLDSFLPALADALTEAQARGRVSVQVVPVDTAAKR
ncbi:MAG TPA: hypothetical protein VE684_21140, partial [Crenalkalicoccus sp.]|nr:hypothetical protein [Crenalkalicoccus sp.]